MCERHILSLIHSVFFFFQAEDGIRDLTVTGVQTCALPICVPDGVTPDLSATGLPEDSTVTFTPATSLGLGAPSFNMHVKIGPDTPAGEIGRGAGRGRGEISVGAGSFKKKKKKKKVEYMITE